MAVAPQSLDALAAAAAQSRAASETTEQPLTVEAHDHQQLEVQLAHSLTAAPDSGKEDEEAYDLELYFFIPRNVGVTGANYPRDEFYADLTTYVRIDLPDVTLAELANERNGRSPLAILAPQLDGIDRGEVPSRSLAVEVKLFGHVFTEAVRDEARPLRKRLEDLVHQPGNARWVYLDEVDRFASAAREALSALRRTRLRFEPYARATPHVMEVFHQTDEYSSLFLDGALAKIARVAEEHTALFDGSGFVGRLRQMLARHAEEEARYRQRMGYLCLEDRDEAAREYFAYRQSFLKKAVHQALYVDTRRLPTDKFVRNATGAVAAGLGATWAVATQLPLTLQSTLQTLTATQQAMFMVVPVVAYMAKDRIKELSREWLSRRVRSFDHDTAIRSGSLAEAGLGSVSGKVQEACHFKEVGEVPREIFESRIANRTVRGAEVSGETVLVYKRRILLQREPQEKAVQPGTALRQIVRLNLRHFLTRLDEPLQLESHFALETERFLSVRLPKVYHLNLVARVAHNGKPGPIRRSRVVLNKHGILRIEPVEQAQVDLASHLPR